MARTFERRGKACIEEEAANMWARNAWMRIDGHSVQPMTLDQAREIAARNHGYAPNEYRPPRTPKQRPNIRR